MPTEGQLLAGSLGGCPVPAQTLQTGGFQVRGVRVDADGLAVDLVKLGAQGAEDLSGPVAPLRQGHLDQCLILRGDRSLRCGKAAFGRGDGPAPATSTPPSGAARRLRAGVEVAGGGWSSLLGPQRNQQARCAAGVTLHLVRGENDASLPPSRQGSAHTALVSLHQRHLRRRSVKRNSHTTWTGERGLLNASRPDPARGDRAPNGKALRATPRRGPRHGGSGLLSRPSPGAGWVPPPSTGEARAT